MNRTCFACRCSLTVLSSLVLVEPATAQIALSGTSYSQNFDFLGTGPTFASALPDGLTVRLGATATTLGTAVTTVDNSGPPTAGAINTMTVTWADVTGGARNVASGTGLSNTASDTTQNSTANRALGIRQTGSFGDPGAAVTFQFADTAGVKDFRLSASLQNLNVQGRDTTWTVRYAVGSAPTSFTTLGTYTTGGAFDVNTTAINNVALGADADNQGQNLWIQFAALSTSAGSGSRDVFAVDDVVLTFTPVPEPTPALATAAVGLGLAAARRRSFPRTADQRGRSPKPFFPPIRQIFSRERIA